MTQENECVVSITQ